MPLGYQGFSAANRETTIIVANVNRDWLSPIKLTIIGRKAGKLGQRVNWDSVLSTNVNETYWTSKCVVITWPHDV
jgi:hypothetical protein